MRHELAMAAVALTVLSSLTAAESGISIEPGESDVFEYADDFTSPAVFSDAITEDLDPTCWTPGSLVSSGPHGSRKIIYRFHARRLLDSFDIRVEQAANARNLGGRNTLFVSANGLDWQEAATSSDQVGGESGWQDDPLTALWRNFVKRRSERRPEAETPAMRLGLALWPWTWSRILNRRLFPWGERIPPGWEEVYRREIVTPQVGRNLRHELQNAY